MRGLAKNLSLRAAQGERRSRRARRGASTSTRSTSTRAAARGLRRQQAATELGVEERRAEARPGQRAARSSRSCRTSRSKTALAPKAQARDELERRRARGGARAAPRSRPARAHPRGLRRAAASWARRPTSSSATSRPSRASSTRRSRSSIQSARAAGKIGADGRGARLRAGGGAGQVLGDDRADRSSTWARRISSTRCWPSSRRRAPSARSYALKLLQSEGELTIASTGQGPGDGQAGDPGVPRRGPGDDLPDDDRDRRRRGAAEPLPRARRSTRAASRRGRSTRRQRAGATLEGLAREGASAGGSSQRCTRTPSGCLRPLAVVNPYARQLTFLDDRTRTRRDHEKYLTLIDAIALLHQHQRPR